MRPFGDVISLEAARAILDATGAPIDRTSRHRALATRTGACWQPTSSRAGMCRRFRVPAWTAMPCGRATRRARRDAHPRTLTKVGTVYTGEVPADAGARRPVRRDFDGRADARWRRRGRDGRGDRFRRRRRPCGSSPRCSHSRMSARAAQTFKPARSSSLPAKL